MNFLAAPPSFARALASNFQIRRMSATPYNRTDMTSTHDMRIPDAICFSHQNIVPSWGFVIFRCTYASQSQWDKIQSHVKQQTLKRLNRKGHEQLRNNLTWTVIEDASTLDGAEWHAPYDLFTKWVQDEVDRTATEDEHRRGVEYWRQPIAEFRATNSTYLSTRNHLTALSTPWNWKLRTKNT